IGAFPPEQDRWGAQASLIHSGLRFIWAEPSDWLFEVPNDWSMAERMLKIGVRFAVLHEPRVGFYPSQGLARAPPARQPAPPPGTVAPASRGPPQPRNLMPGLAAGAEQALLAARPQAQARRDDPGVVVVALVAQPGQRGLGGRAIARRLDGGADLLLQRGRQVGPEHRVEDDGGDARRRLGQLARDPGVGALLVELHREGAGDVQGRAQADEADVLVGPQARLAGAPAMGGGGVGRGEVAAAAALRP